MASYPILETVADNLKSVRKGKDQNCAPAFLLPINPPGNSFQERFTPSTVI